MVDANKIFEVDKHNRITFTISQQQLLHYSHSLVTVLYKIVPLILQRKRKDVYQIGKTLREKSGWREWPTIMLSVDAPEYFTGIQFDLTTQTCLNPRPNLLDTVIPEVRKQWLRDVKRFKRGLKARAKVGALQGYIEEVKEERNAHVNGDWGYKNDLPNWEDSRITQQVLDCLRTEQYPPDLLKLVVQTTYLGWGSGEITSSMVLENVDKVFNTHSIHYRKAYGVFDAQTT